MQATILVLDVPSISLLPLQDPRPLGQVLGVREKTGVLVLDGLLEGVILPLYPKEQKSNESDRQYPLEGEKRP